MTAHGTAQLGVDCYVGADGSGAGHFIDSPPHFAHVLKGGAPSLPSLKAGTRAPQLSGGVGGHHYLDGTVFATAETGVTHLDEWA